MIEKRFNPTHEIRITDEKVKRVSGYAAVFDVFTKIGSQFEERIAKGAFSNSLKSDRSVAALWNHNTDLVIGDTGNQTLSLQEDDRGLQFDLTPADTSAGRDAYELIRGNFVKGVSFGFRVKKDTWERGDDTKPHRRTILDVELFEISPTRFPAYDQTLVAARSSEEVLKEVESNWAFEDKKKKDAEKPAFSMEDLRAQLDLQKMYIDLQ